MSDFIHNLIHDDGDMTAMIDGLIFYDRYMMKESTRGSDDRSAS